jgi:hypothetical protein
MAASDRPHTPNGTTDVESAGSSHSGHAPDGATKEPTTKTESQPEEINTATKALLLVSVILSVFLIALDRTIISTVRLTFPFPPPPVQS